MALAHPGLHRQKQARGQGFPTGQSRFAAGMGGFLIIFVEWVNIAMEVRRGMNPRGYKSRGG